MRINVNSTRSRSFHRLNVPGKLVLLRSSSLARLETEHKRMEQFIQLILGRRSSPGVELRSYAYAIWHGQPSGSGPILYATHQAGLFSCFTTIMWTIIEIQQSDLMLPKQISNTFGMDAFKNCPLADTFPRWFELPSGKALADLSCIKPLGDLMQAPNLFDHHGNYEILYGQLLGPAWLATYFQAYMNPALSLRDAIYALECKYNISRSRTLVVCYRGTDKFTELQQDPVSLYIETAKHLIKELAIEQLIIQTDQVQVRTLFQNLFGEQCIFIEELPATDGQVVLHEQLAGSIDRDTWALNLLAMVYACSKAAAVLTHTGNLGLFLSLVARSQGAEVVQLR